MNPAPPVTSQRAISRRRLWATDSPMGGKSPSRQARHESQRVAVVQLPQDHVGQVQAVELPEGVVVPVVVEILVRGLERPPEVRILAGDVRVLAEQDPVLVLDEERSRRARLPSQFGKDRAGFGHDVRVLVEQPPEARQVVGVIREVRGDERRLRVPRKQAIPLGHQRLECRELACRAAGAPGWTCSSSQRSLVSVTGSKNGAGSAVWISTGTL